MYLTELPLLFLLIVAICYNGQATGFVRLYPLIIALVLGMIFIFIYLFRLISVSTEEIRSIGPFSTRDRAIINEGKTLILTVRKHGKLKMELFGNDGTPPMLDWAQSEEHEIMDIFLFRGKAVGGKRTVARVLRYFDVPADEAAQATEDGFKKEYDAFEVSTERREDITEVRIRFTKTI